jgi:hypothetical protein
MSNNPRTREEYAADPHTAAYWWRAMRDGVLLAEEYDASGNEHRFTEIPGMDVINGKPMLTGGGPMMLFAIPYRPEELPPLDLLVKPGEPIVWLHRVILMAAAGNYDGPPMIRFETLLFGTELLVPQRFAPLSITQVYPNGTYTKHASVADALKTPLL